MGYNATQAKGHVSYDLSNEDYTSNWEEYTFYFSTMAHKVKFDEGVQTRIDWLNDSLSRRFHYDIHADVLAVFQLYKMIEGRGFKVYDNLIESYVTSPMFNVVRVNVIHDERD